MPRATTKPKAIVCATRARPQCARTGRGTAPGQTKGTGMSNCDAPQGNAAARKQKRRMCAHPGCKPNRAIGATGFCKRHGGGKRCAHKACTKGAEGATDFCSFHGGGKRCAHKEGCTKSAEGATTYRGYSFGSGVASSGPRS